MYLISVYFDEHTAKTLQRYIDLIAAHTGNVFMTEHRVPPHLTLSAIEARSVEVLCPAFEVMQEHFQPMKMTVTEIGLAKVNPHEDVARFEML